MATGSSSTLSWLLPLLLAGAGAATGIAGSLGQRKRDATQAALTREELAARQALADQDTAVKESALNPFRHQLDQAGAIGTLDRQERGAYSPVKLTPNFATPDAMPAMSGGFSYEKSPELVSSAAALKRNVMGGNVAPTMTNPANYGRTAALDLVRIAADGVDPATVNGSAGAGARGVSTTTPPTDPLAGVARRGGSAGGGVLKGAVTGAGLGTVIPGVGNLVGAGLGAATGAVIGAFGKQAKTSATDLDVNTATQVLTQVMQQELGRAPGPGEIQQLLASQGLKPGDRWVGDAGLRGLIQRLRSQAATSMQPSYAARG